MLTGFAPFEETTSAIWSDPPGLMRRTEIWLLPASTARMYRPSLLSCSEPWEAITVPRAGAADREGRAGNRSERPVRVAVEAGDRVHAGCVVVDIQVADDAGRRGGDGARSGNGARDREHDHDAEATRDYSEPAAPPAANSVDVDSQFARQANCRSLHLGTSWQVSAADSAGSRAPSPHAGIHYSRRDLCMGREQFSEMTSAPERKSPGQQGFFYRGAEI